MHEYISDTSFRVRKCSCNFFFFACVVVCLFVVVVFKSVSKEAYGLNSCSVAPQRRNACLHFEFSHKLLNSCTHTHIQTTQRIFVTCNACITGPWNANQCAVKLLRLRNETESLVPHPPPTHTNRHIYFFTLCCMRTAIRMIYILHALCTHQHTYIHTYIQAYLCMCIAAWAHL